MEKIDTRDKVLVEDDFIKFLNNFRWKTMEGNILTIKEMETGHVFNSMKMVYNHLAENVGMETVWFTKKYSNYEEMAEYKKLDFLKQILAFIWTIETRQDLPDKYLIPYLKIKYNLKQAFEHVKIESSIKLLE